MNIAEFSRVEARCPTAPRAKPVNALYGREWEACEGSRGIRASEAAEWIVDCELADRGDPHKPEYRFVPGREMTDAEFEQWLALEHKMNRQLTDVEFIAALEI